jgi:hypothetical protein
MKQLREAMVEFLRNKNKDIPAANIRFFNRQLDETSEGLISLPAPGIIIFVRDSGPVPENVAAFNLRANFGICLTDKTPSATERDINGWERAIDLYDQIDKVTWGLNTKWIRACIVESIKKIEGRDLKGGYTGVDYWAIEYYNWIRTEAYFGRE